jgi:hypothetical protein
MQILTYTIDSLLHVLRDGNLDAPRFIRDHPGAFLVAMGFMSVKEITARTSPGTTGGVKLGQPLRHDPQQQHPLAGQVFCLRVTEAGGRAVLGRGGICDILVPDGSVSDHHCTIEIADDGTTVTDLASTNGTRVNLQELAPNQAALLSDEDILTVGRYSFQYHSPATLYDALHLLTLLSG